jgi:tryptophan-rich sensory protein
MAPLSASLVPGLVLPAVGVLLVLAGFSLVLNPANSDLRWYATLRRPQWLGFSLWSLFPQLRGLTSLGFYGAALVVWIRLHSLGWVALVLAVGFLAESRFWITCRSRRLIWGLMVGLLSWLAALLLVLQLHSQVPLVTVLLLPQLLWTPLEMLTTLQMIQLNR